MAETQPYAAPAHGILSPRQCSAHGKKAQGFAIFYSKPRAAAAGYYHLLMSKGGAKTIRMSLSRERRSAALKRAPDAGLQANRPRFFTLRLHAVLFPLQAIMRNPDAAKGGDESGSAKKALRKMRTKSASGGDGLFTNPRIVARSQR